MPYTKLEARLLPSKDERHTSVEGAYLAAQDAEGAGYVILFVGYGSAMNKDDAGRSLPHRAEQWWQEQNDLSKEFLDPTPITVDGLARVLTASDALIQPPPPAGARLFMFRDSDKPTAYDGLMGVMGVRPKRGASMDATGQLMSAEETAMLAAREKSYRLRFEDASKVRGVPPEIDGKKVLLAYFEPLPRSNWACNNQQRMTSNGPEPVELKISQGYVEVTLDKVEALSAQAAARGMAWNPSAEITPLMTSVPTVNTQLTPISSELIGDMLLRGSQYEMVNYARTVSDPAGQRERSMHISLEEYTKGSAYDLHRLGIPSPRIDEAASLNPNWIASMARQAAAAGDSGSLV